jgi:hypothetical protein
MRFFLLCLKQIGASLLVDAQDALVIAERYWQNSSDNADALSEARTQMLNQVTAAVRTDSSAETPYRLVSFVLELPTECAVDYLEWFEVYMERIGADPAIFESALIEVFGPSCECVRPQILTPHA